MSSSREQETKGASLDRRSHYVPSFVQTHGRGIPPSMTGEHTELFGSPKRNRWWEMGRLQTPIAYYSNEKKLDWSSCD